MSENKVPLGKLVDGEQFRDAIHIAVAPVTAAVPLSPGEHVGMLDGQAMRSANPIGVVDPFLRDTVAPGQRFWMLLYPYTITSLRHEWIHPAFGGPQAPATDPKAASREWLTKFAEEFGMSCDALIRAAKEHIDSGEWVTLDYDTPDIAWTQRQEMWRHYEIVTGEKVEDHDEQIFTCAC